MTKREKKLIEAIEAIRKASNASYPRMSTGPAQVWRSAALLAISDMCDSALREAGVEP